MNSKDALALKKAKFQRLKGLTDQPGWNDFRDFIVEEYQDALSTLKDPKTVKAEVEARGVVKFIDRMMSRFLSELKFGKVATEEYVRKYINNPDGDEQSA